MLRTGREYKHISTVQMNEVCMASPALTENTLLIRGRSHLFSIGTKK